MIRQLSTLASAGALVAGGLVLAGCGGSGDAAACKAAMSSSTTGPFKWAADKATRPAACKDVDDATFDRLSAEFVKEFLDSLGTPS